jgi:hypothetical protein
MTTTTEIKIYLGTQELVDLVPAVDAVAGDTAISDSLAWTHAVGDHIHRLLMVSVSLRDAVAVQGITFGGSQLKLLKAVQPGADVRQELWYLENPAVGSEFISVTAEASTTIVGASVSVYNVLTSDPFRALASGFGIT